MLGLLLDVTQLGAQSLPPPRVRQDIVLDSALQRAARALYPAATGALLKLRKLYTYPAPREGAQFEKYEVLSDGGAALGTFLRMQVDVPEGSRIELALKLEGPRLVGVHALSPVLLGGRAALGLPAMLASLSDHDVRDYSPGMALLFESLPQLEAASEGRQKRIAVTGQQALKLKQALNAATPSLIAGTAMPQFAALDRQGQEFSPARLLGHRALIVAGRVQTQTTQRLLEWLHRYSAAKTERFRLAEVMANRPSELEQFELRGGRLGGIVVPDSKRRVLAALHVTLMPSLLVFDRASRLVRQLEPPFESYEALESLLDAVE